MAKIKILLFPILIIIAFFQLAKESISKKIDGYKYKRKVEKNEREKRKYIHYITPRTRV